VSETEPLLAVEGLSKHFPARTTLFGRATGVMRAVDAVSFSIGRGETLALVGESGCGKSTTARLVLRLLEPTAGRIRFRERDVTRLAGEELRGVRRGMNIVFQDPFSSLDPRMTVEEIVAEPLVAHAIGNRRSRRARVLELLSLVGLSDSQARRHPHEFSGGQRQRIGIARALAANPALVVCDEPVSALDVSIQAQIVNLLQDLQARLGLSYLFIAHDLAVVKHIADRVAVMYLGRIVEIAPKDVLFADPRHPYTRTLLAAIPRPDPYRRDARELRPAEPTKVQATDAGCPFLPRCAFAVARCGTEMPTLTRIGPEAAGHRAACHRAAELLAIPAGQHARPLSPAAARRLQLYAELRAREAPAR
jgi:oligopeptide transport system ATP-binding protein